LVTPSVEAAPREKDAATRPAGKSTVDHVLSTPFPRPQRPQPSTQHDRRPLYIRRHRPHRRDWRHRHSITPRLHPRCHPRCRHALGQAFLSRHGLSHELAPHEVKNQANIAALRHLGVRTIIAFSAVGSLQEEVRPRDFVVPDQVIDRTKGIRPFTFFEKGMVGHVGFGDPFDLKLAELVRRCGHSLEGEGVTLHDKGTIICMEGPQFSTRAESNMYRSWGGTVINMSALPEAKLAREAEIAYQMICMATDYDCWRGAEGEDVNVEMVMGHMKANADNARRFVGAVLNELSKEEHAELVQAKHVEGQMKFAGAMTKKEARGEEAEKKLQWLFPGYFD
jgi:5'-methylthioadenosine phosphorylase